MLRTRQRRLSSAAYTARHREHNSNKAEDRGRHTDHDPQSEVMVAESAQEAISSQEPPSNQSAPDVEIDELTSDLSSLKFVPPSVRFGRGGRRGGLSRS